MISKKTLDDLVLATVTAGLVSSFYFGALLIKSKYNSIKMPSDNPLVIEVAYDINKDGRIDFILGEYADRLPIFYSREPTEKEILYFKDKIKK